MSKSAKSHCVGKSHCVYWNHWKFAKKMVGAYFWLSQWHQIWWVGQMRRSTTQGRCKLCQKNGCAMWSKFFVCLHSDKTLRRLFFFLENFVTFLTAMATFPYGNIKFFQIIQKNLVHSYARALNKAETSWHPKF